MTTWMVKVVTIMDGWERACLGGEDDMNALSSGDNDEKKGKWA